MKIIITGTNSYFGNSLSKFFLKKKMILKKINRSKNFNIKENIFNYSKYIKNFDYFIYLAHDYSKLSTQSNIKILKKIIQLKKKRNIKNIIYISSMSAYKFNESRYGKSKFEIEKFCVDQGIIIIRPGLIFGGKKKSNLDKMLNILRFFPILPIYKNRKNYIYSVSINELNNAILRILIKKEGNYKIYNIFSKKKIYFDELIKKLTKNKKIYININYKVFLFLIRILNIILSIKSIDSILSFMTSKKKFDGSLKEKNILTQKYLI